MTGKKGNRKPGQHVKYRSKRNLKQKGSGKRRK